MGTKGSMTYNERGKLLILGYLGVYVGHSLPLLGIEALVDLWISKVSFS